MKTQVEPQHYFNMEYDSKERFLSYWYQINEILKLEPNKMLEIGIGNGFVSRYLRSRGLNITTMDIDQRLEPNKVGSVLNIPFHEKSFDVVACYEVLEHLPFEKFKEALKEIYRVTSKYAIVSLPDVTPVYRLIFYIPYIGLIQKLIPVHFMPKRPHVFDGQHYWEIGKKNFNYELIEDTIEDSKFHILKSFRLKDNPYHRFYILSKNR